MLFIFCPVFICSAMCELLVFHYVGPSCVPVSLNIFLVGDSLSSCLLDLFGLASHWPKEAADVRLIDLIIQYAFIPKSSYFINAVGFLRLTT
jgi:hypothetical protein